MLTDTSELIMFSFFSRIKRTLKRITGFSTPLGGLSWKSDSDLNSNDSKVLSSIDCASVLGVDKEVVEELLESGQLGGFKITNQWRITFEHLTEYLRKESEKSVSDIFLKKIQDPTAWADALRQMPELMKDIESGDFPENSMGKFLQESFKVEDEKVELGFLDHVFNVHHGFEALTTSIGKITELLNKITKQSNNITKKVNRLSVKPSQKSTMKIRNLLRIEGIILGKYSDKMCTINNNYHIQLITLSDSIEYAVLSEITISTGDTEGLREFLAALNKIEENSQSFMKTFQSLLDIVDRLPNMEKTYNSSKKSFSREITRFIENIDRTAEMITRIRPHIMNILNN